MSRGVELRRTLPGDLPQIARIEAVSFSDPWPADSLLTEMRSDRMRRPLTALRGGVVVGYLMAWKVADEWHVINLAVATAERRTGIGTLLLEASLSAAAAEGCRSATLEVRVGNEPALSFYARHGFRPLERRPRYYRDTGEDALVLFRSLRPAQG
jgi:ribosomal-protein-alanine N-acetyltransferase